MQFDVSVYTITYLAQHCRQALAAGGAPEQCASAGGPVRRAGEWGPQLPCAESAGPGLYPESPGGLGKPHPPASPHLVAHSESAQPVAHQLCISVMPPPRFFQLQQASEKYMLAVEGCQQLALAIISLQDLSNQSPNLRWESAAAWYCHRSSA